MKIIEQLVELMYLDRIQIVASEIPKFIELLVSLGIRLDCLSFEFDFGSQFWNTLQWKYEIVMKGKNYS
jgi:plasmid maintenance system antidote protein VapI